MGKGESGGPGVVYTIYNILYLCLAMKILPMGQAPVPVNADAVGV